MSSDLLHRMVLVRPIHGLFRGTQPLTFNGMWSGVVVDVTPVKQPSGETADCIMKIKLSFGTARAEQMISLPISDGRWQLRFPSRR